MSMSQRCCGLECHTGCFPWQKPRGLTLLTTPAVMDELREVLGRAKFSLRLRILRTSVAELMESILSLIEMVHDLSVEPVIKRDPDDDKFLACALAGQADWIISGDDHLLGLKHYNGIPIVTSRQFLRSWDKRK